MRNTLPSRQRSSSLDFPRAVTRSTRSTVNSWSPDSEMRKPQARTDLRFSGRGVSRKRATSSRLPSRCRRRSASPEAAEDRPGCLRDQDRCLRPAPDYWPFAPRLPAAWPAFPFDVPGAGARAGASVARVSICSPSDCTTITRSCHNDPCHLPNSDYTPACCKGSKISAFHDRRPFRLMPSRWRWRGRTCSRAR